MAKQSDEKPASAEVLGVDIIARLCGALEPAALSAADRAALHAQVMSRIGAGNPVIVGSAAPAGTVTLRAVDMKWVGAGPGVEIKVLRRDLERGDQTVLIRMQPGAVVVSHRHTQEEECLVLEGAVLIGDHALHTGDMHVAKPGVRHEAIRAPQGALLLIRSEVPPSSFRIA